MYANEYPNGMTPEERTQEIARVLANGFLSKMDQEQSVNQIDAISPKQMDQASSMKATERFENSENSVSGLDLSNHL